MSNKILFNLAILSGQLTYFVLRVIGRQGTALPGKVALKICPDILRVLAARCHKTVVITGTNGKTTTNNLINHILSGNYNNLVSNHKGANMIQGVVTSFIVNNKNYYDWGVFEVDEGSMHIITHFLSPNYVILTNFFRDQLDRYGEVDNTIKIVYDALESVDSTIILNADDPSTILFNKLPNNKIYYGFNQNQFSKKYQSVSEAIFCKECDNRLDYEFISYGNIGNYCCDNCNTKRPRLNYAAESIVINDDVYEFVLKINNNYNEEYNTGNSEDVGNTKYIKDSEGLEDIIYAENVFIFRYLGIYNIYNCLAAITLCLSENFDILFVKNQIRDFDYKLGRMETINFPNKDVVLVLAKNPIGLSEVLNTLSYNEDPKNVMFCLNDSPADGTDTSWLWDADFEQLKDIKNITTFYCSGIRAKETVLRLKYIDFDINKIETYVSKDINDIKKPVREILSKNEKSYIIGSFTALPPLRKALLVEKRKWTDLLNIDTKKEKGEILRNSK